MFGKSKQKVDHPELADYLSVVQGSAHWTELNQMINYFKVMQNLRAVVEIQEIVAMLEETKRRGYDLRQ
jgi:hypothetical protein